MIDCNTIPNQKLITIILTKEEESVESLNNINFDIPYKDQSRDHITQENKTLNFAQSPTTGKWKYRTHSSPSISSISNTTDYQAEALKIADVSQRIHKIAQLSLCKGLFGMHNRRGRGRPKKFNKKTQVTTKNTKLNSPEASNTQQRQHR